MDRKHLFKQCRSLVPLGTMREHHLQAALDDATLVAACQGDLLFDGSEPLESLFYLLSGEVLLKHQSGRERIITADFHWLPVVQFRSEQFTSHALTDCMLLKFDRYALDNLITWSQVADYLDLDISYERKFDDDAEWMATILNSNLFYKIPPINVFSIYNKVSSVEVEAEQVILSQGDMGDYCYFIKEGRAEVTRHNELDQSETTLAVIGDGRCFGEDALIQQTTRNATVKMLTDGTLIRLHKDDFNQLLLEPSVDHLDVQSLDEFVGEGVCYLDVRTQEEFDYKHLNGAIHIPLTLLRLKIRLLDKSKKYLIYCNTGLRSRAAAYLLLQKGYDVTVLNDGLANITPEQVANLLVSEFDAIHQLATYQH